ncbi:diacylglycerol kinase family protein [Hoylesella oralis]|uniref:diacylglycerol/lipid kinase family protein n=1 Tax=Hoylesella oralis TaxID=28134 RepID=UPI0028E2EB6C|nr:diacylglycerol kinase family protein [Hoylesella oralis]
MAGNSLRWGVIYCPKSTARNARKRWNRIERYLDEQDIQYDYVHSESSESVERLVTMMINNGYKTIVIAGGDSALNDAANCLMREERAVRESISLGVIPCGVMNDFAHFWNLKEGEEDIAIAQLKKHRVRRIDLGCIRYKNKHDEACHRYFLNCVNVGLVASIMNLRRQTKRIFGSRTLSFLFSFILLIFQRMEYKMRIKINTDSIHRSVMTMCVGNALGYGQTPNAVPYNGLLDVSVVYHSEMMQLFGGIYLFLQGKILNHKGVYPYRTYKVMVEESHHAPVSIDGRLMNTPVGAFTLTVEQEVINFLIPD